MGKRLRKIISILLVIVMIIGMCPNSVVLAKESMDSGMTATSTDAEEGITEESDTSTETDIQIDEETYPAFNPEPVIIDGVRISVSAAEGVFPEGASLSVAKVSNAELGAVEEALDVERDETEKVAISYTYDIKVFDKDGNELQPEEGADVKVSFSLDAVANENLETNIYHISEDASGSLSADILPMIYPGNSLQNLFIGGLNPYFQLDSALWHGLQYLYGFLIKIIYCHLKMEIGAATSRQCQQVFQDGQKM